MAWLMSKVYDRFMAETEAACLAGWRRELLAGASGETLEVGVGTGANLGLYPTGVSRLVLTEPDPDMRAALAKKGALPDGVELVGDALGTLPMAAESFDTVVCTLVLCSVPDQPAAIADLWRVLRPGGRLLFVEHVAAEEDSRRYRWQRRIEPLWKHVAGGCHLTRRTDAALQAAGFRFEQVQRESMRKALPWVRPSVRGVAVRP